MMTTRAQLAPALLLLLVLLAAATPLVPALTPLEIRDRKINGANKLYIMGVDPDAYAAGEKKSTPEAPKDAVQKTSYVMGAGVEPEPESKSDEKVLEAKINAEVKAMRKEAAHDDAVAEKKAKEEFKSKPKNTTDDAEDQAKEKKSKSKSDSSEDDAVEKKSKSKVDYSADAEKKPKNKDDDSEEKKSKSKSDSSEDIDDEKKEKKSKSKDDDDEKKEKKSKSKEEDYAEKKLKSKDEDDDKTEKKSKSKEEDSKDDSEKKSKIKSESSEDAADKKKSKSKNKEKDFDVVPIESNADESVPAADTPDKYQAPTKKTAPRLPAVDTTHSYQAPVITTMSAADTPDGYLTPNKAEQKMSAEDTPDGYAAPTTMSAADTPDGYVTPSKAQPAMSAADTPDGYVPATESPDGNVPASDSPDGYAAPSTKTKVNVQSFSEMVPQSVLQMLSPTVKSLCSKTSFPYTCQTSIAKLPETTVVPARQKDGLGVLTLAVDAVRAKLAEAKNAAKELAVDPHTDKISKGAISDCLQMYDDIGTSYDTALAALKSGDRGAATSAVDAARTFVDTCDQGFLDRPGLKPVMADQEKALAQLTSNVLAINKFMYI